MIHLDIHTDFSFGKAYGSVEQVATRVKELGETSAGIADICSTWGHLPWWKACKKAKIRPLFGVQLPVVAKLDKDPRHDLVTLVARNFDGLVQQYELLSLATQNFYYRPRITWDELAHGASDNEIILNRTTPETSDHFFKLKEGWLGSTFYPGYLQRLCVRHPDRVLISSQPLYPRPQMRECYQLAVSIGSARKTFDVEAVDQWIFSKAELISKFLGSGVDITLLDAWIAATISVAERCVAEPAQAQNVKPRINRTVEEWCDDGARMRGIDISSGPYQERLRYELGLVHEKGFADYFLLIADLISWAKERMFVGPARGSSAGSLVCFLMGIVEVDPLVHGLMFERFIDVTRTDLPDVDIDFPDDRRDECFEYLATKYGAARVARLGTVNVFKSKSALGSVAKSYAVPKWKVDELSTVLIERSGGDARANMTIMDTIVQFDKAKALVEEYPKLRMAEHLEGHAHHTGKHAAGVCISNEPIVRYCAIDHYRGGIGMLTKYDAEAIGLMKIDALGLKTLSVIQDCCEMVGVDPRHLYTVPLDHEPVFKVFMDDRVAGVFQFEGYAVRSLMRQMGVRDFNDITALTSLARPGPLHCGGANEFIARRANNKNWEYQHPLLHAHTGHTYGTIVYQEQVMSITRDLGGMDWQDVNALRRAMSKSLGEEFFNQYRDKFVLGAEKRGVGHDVALEIWSDMCTFGSWAFNLSHAVSYAIISYWCAYLKSKYPLEFAVANLRRSATQDHAFRLLRELDKEGYEIVPFDVEHSQVSWSTDGQRILGGFTAVRGVGVKTAEKFLEKRALDPEDWLTGLTLAQRSKLMMPNNTPWHNLKRLQTLYHRLYNRTDTAVPFNNPEKNPVPIMIEDIPEVRGDYRFIATLKVRNLRDVNETQSIAKRAGRVVESDTLFLNLQFEDDTGSILATIERLDYEKWGKPLMEEESDGCDFMVGGRIIKDGRRRLKVENIFKLNPETGTIFPIPPKAEDKSLESPVEDIN